MLINDLAIMEYIPIGIVVFGTMILLWHAISLDAPVGEILGNGNEAAIAATIDMVNRAQGKIELFDDGNNDPDYVYNDLDFVEAVRNKLKDEERNFQIKCFFNERDVKNLLFVKELGREDGVDIRVRKKWLKKLMGRPKSAHYRSVDGADYLYLSRHEYGEDERECQIVSCADFQAQEKYYYKLLFLLLYKQVNWKFDKFDKTELEEVSA